jgi:hypothetical protein
MQNVVNEQTILTRKGRQVKIPWISSVSRGGLGGLSTPSFSVLFLKIGYFINNTKACGCTLQK